MENLLAKIKWVDEVAILARLERASLEEQGRSSQKRYAHAAETPSLPPLKKVKVQRDESEAGAPTTVSRPSPSLIESMKVEPDDSEGDAKSR